MIDRQVSLGAALLIVLKWVLIALAAVIGLGAVAGGAYWAYHYFTYELPVSKIKPLIENNRTDCTNEFPIFVGFGNSSSRTVARISFVLIARVPGHSSDVAKYQPHSMDRILKPKEGYGYCYKVEVVDEEKARDPRTLQWSVRITSVEFED